MTEKPSPTFDEINTYDDEITINLGKYIETLVRQWQWIAVCALGLGFLALAYSLYTNQTSPSYQAEALVASAKTGYNANFDSAITSEAAASANTQNFYDRTARLQSFVALVQNSTVAQKVLDEFATKINKNDGVPISIETLKSMVSAELIPKTDTIQISFTYSDPLLAAEIANAWGMAYVQWINDLYGGSSSGTSFLASQAQTSQAKTDFEKAQAVLDDYIAQNRIDEYNRQINDISSINDSLREARISVDDQQVQDYLARLDQAYSEKRQIGLFLDNAVSMRAAVYAGGEPAAISNALAMTLLKTQIYATFPNTNTLNQDSNLPPVNNTLNLGSNLSIVDATGMIADLDALISTLKTRQTELISLVDTLSSQIQTEDYFKNFSNANTPIEKKILENEQKIQDLKSLVSTDTSTLDELTRGRDLAWQIYSTLATKTAEMRVASQTIGNEVVFASPATPPDSSVSQVSQANQGQRNALLAVAVGLLIGVITSYAYEFWQNYKGRQPEIILKKMFAYVSNLGNNRRNKSAQKVK
jgi:uncharacterized protein involved in exopolysaccharide biosynthesis